VNIWSRMAKDILEYNNGRIWKGGGNWVFADAIPKGYEKVHPESPTFGRSVDANGREMVLISQKGIQCHNPEIGKGYPQSKDKEDTWWVSESFCKKCEHYRKADAAGQLRFARCEWLRQQRGGNRGALKQAVEIVQEANKMVAEILK
jgi:hypothetical protein